jgi:hypothetical protein
VKLLFDEDLLEAVVFLCASGQRGGVSARQVRRFHGERERLYSILEPDERQAAFFRLHLEWFREWGLERLLVGVVDQFALLGARLEVMAFRKARSQSEEGAELYVNEEGHRHGIVALRPARFQADADLVRFVHHELQHLSDMLDPEFGYSPHIAQPGHTASQQRLMRERYRLLWDSTIDGRLTAKGRDTVARREQRQAEFNRAYSFLPEAKRAQTFEWLWNNPAPRHAELLKLAADPRELNASAPQIAGAPCPLCGFATFRWAAVEALTPDLVARVQTEFRAWTAEQGACARCLEVYQSAMNLAGTCQV